MACLRIAPVVELRLDLTGLLKKLGSSGQPQQHQLEQQKRL